VNPAEQDDVTAESEPVGANGGSPDPDVPNSVALIAGDPPVAPTT